MVETGSVMANITKKIASMIEGTVVWKSPTVRGHALRRNACVISLKSSTVICLKYLNCFYLYM